MNFTDETVKEAIESGKPVVVDFWATWCGPCKRMSPIIDEIAREYEGRVVVGKYNVEEETDLAMENRIMSIPVLLFFNHGQQARELRMTGTQSKESVVANIEKLLAL